MSEQISAIKITPDEHDLQRIERDLNALEPALELAVYDAMAELEFGYEDAARFVGAIDTGEFLESIGIYTNSAKAADVVAGVSYSGIIEEGARGRNYPGRYPARKALEKFVLDNKFEEVLDRTLQEFLHGSR